MKSNVSIEPSILSADFTRLGEQAKEAEDAGAEGLQIDVMDGHFVPNLTFGPGIVKSLRRGMSIFLDTHLMIDNPDAFLQEFAKAGSNRIIVHAEVCKDLQATLRKIRNLNVEAGVALNPETPAETVKAQLGDADCVQVMTVHPGFAGQSFMEDQLNKVRWLSQEIESQQLNMSIVVDGGIDSRTAPLAVKSGADVLVAGSSIYNQVASVQLNIATLRKSISSIVSHAI